MNKKWIKKFCIMNLTCILVFSSTAQAETLGIVTADVLNIRSNPTTASTILSKTYMGSNVSILSKEGSWYKINTAKGIGYVHSDYIEESSNTKDIVNSVAAASAIEKGLVTVPVLNVRKTASITGDVIGKLSQNTVVSLLGTEGDWYKIKTSDAQIGYVFSTYISKYNPAAVSDIRSQVINYAKEFLGNPYVYGGTSLTNGIDCSSFTQQILRKFGYGINRTSGSQYSNGTRISVNQLLPGDLVFYGYSGVISHVAMYIGSGKIIHASSPKTGIIISNLYPSGGKPIIGATRIIQ